MKQTSERQLKKKINEILNIKVDLGEKERRYKL